MRTRTLRGVAAGVLAWLVASPTGAARAQPADPLPEAPAPAVASPAAALAAAQAAEDEIPDLDKLRAPDSPAFLLLGVSPVEIQRPTTPKELSVALGAFVSDGNLAAPDSLAIEIAPYWLFWHPRLTGDDMADPSIDEAALRNLGVSLGTTTRAIDGGADGVTVTDLAIGVRTRVLDGRPRATCWGLVESAAQAIAARQGQLLAAELGAAAARHPTEDVPERANQAERDRIERRNDAAAAAIEAEVEAVRVRTWEEEAPSRVALAEVAARCVEASAARRGWVADVALAGSMRFPAGQLEDGDWLTAGGWTTVAHAWDGHDLIALGRLLADRETGEASLVADLGLRYVYLHGRYGLSAELVYRHLGADVEDTDLFRADIAADMRLHGDVWFTATFARDYAAGDAGDVFALANLKWGLGGPSVKVPGATGP